MTRAPKQPCVACGQPSTVTVQVGGNGTPQGDSCLSCYMSGDAKAAIEAREAGE